MSETASTTELHGRINGMSASIGQLREAVAAQKKLTDGTIELLARRVAKLAERIEKLEEAQSGGVGSIEGLGVTFTVTPWPWFGNDE